MIGFIGADMTQDERNEQWDWLEAFFAYIEDPDSDLEQILAVEEHLEVTHP
ncbi:hypothetical protein KGG72_gp33 [Streptomyces phage Salutena]|uniref:Uncharacterized protein n=1 Tax=Streptomyces phage Salutena TaxID=2767576 RepID=A0A7S6R826_9CAUD|nr:hypothetical protein KGG72_gp33 [Streptomyces phage Salutena]QOV06163.1 hypothetical protein CPT_Salutena_033 [Streptomyces phage Salutena]